MNEICDCKIYLKKANTAKIRKTMYLEAALNSLVILNSSGEIAKMETNRTVVGRIIKNTLGKDFKFDHIVKHEKIKYLGKSLARY